MLRNISPTEMSDFTFCQKLWYYKRKGELVPIKIGFKDIAAYMGITVGWSVDQTIKKINHNPEDYFATLLQEQLNLGRVYDFNVESKVETLPQLITKHITNIWEYQDTWLKGGTIIASEPIMTEFGNARQDVIIEDPQGFGVVGDFKCKLKADSTAFPISRDIDLYGNQAQLYPLAWNQEQGIPTIKTMRFIYIQEDRKPIIEDQIINPRRQEKWLKGYENVVHKINMLEILEEPNSGNMIDYLTENPHHITPWGYPCEFREYCASGEHEQGVLSEFIQAERVKK